MLRWAKMVLGPTLFDSEATACVAYGMPTLGPALRFWPKAIHRKEVARFDLAALFAFQRPVTESFNGNLAEVFRSSGNTTRINLLHKELQWKTW
jgi:hypothetical protein